MRRGQRARLDLAATARGGSDFGVDEAAWSRALSSTRTGLASYLSLCGADGGPVRIVASRSQALLARYDPSTGLETIAR